MSNFGAGDRFQLVGIDFDAGDGPQFIYIPESNWIVITDDDTFVDDTVTIKLIGTYKETDFALSDAGNDDGTYVNFFVGDPLILDLEAEGIDLSYTAAFDMNGDGQLDNIAWTDGQDGILVMDLDASGAIENGKEVFSPYFGQGGYADALEALASFDVNGDGVIDGADPAFAKLLVWQDQNHDGVSDAGELKNSRRSRHHWH